MHLLPQRGYTGNGDEMKVDAQMLTSLLKTTQEGKIAVRRALYASAQPPLRCVLQTQLLELGAIETEVHAIAAQRGWELKEIQPGRRVLMRFRMRMILRGRSDSEIAERMMRRSIHRMIACIKVLHRYQRQSGRISALSQRLADCEADAIRQLQTFL